MSSTWAADQRTMDPEHAVRVFVTDVGIRWAMGSPNPTQTLKRIIDAEMADAGTWLLNECVAQWALERGVQAWEDENG